MDIPKPSLDFLIIITEAPPETRLHNIARNITQFHTMNTTHELETIPRIIEIVRA